MGLLLVINHVLACAWFGFHLVSVELGWTTWAQHGVLNYSATEYDTMESTLGALRPLNKWPQVGLQLPHLFALELVPVHARIYGSSVASPSNRRSKPHLDSGVASYELNGGCCDYRIYKLKYATKVICIFHL